MLCPGSLDHSCINGTQCILQCFLIFHCLFTRSHFSLDIDLKSNLFPLYRPFQGSPRLTPLGHFVCQLFSPANDQTKNCQERRKAGKTVPSHQRTRRRVLAGFIAGHMNLARNSCAHPKNPSMGAAAHGTVSNKGVSGCF